MSTMELFGGIFGITFEPADIPVWHPDVKAFRIKDAQDGRLIAYFYMDLYPREGKYKHAACFDLVGGEEKPDGSYQTPFVAIVANMNKPSQETPSLLKQWLERILYRLRGISEGNRHLMLM